MVKHAKEGLSAKRTRLWISKAAPGKCKICQISQNFARQLRHEKLKHNKESCLGAHSPHGGLPLLSSYNHKLLRFVQSLRLCKKLAHLFNQVGWDGGEQLSLTENKVGMRSMASVWNQRQGKKKKKKTRRGVASKHDEQKSLVCSCSNSSSPDTGLLVWERSGAAASSHIWLKKIIM